MAMDPATALPESLYWAFAHPEVPILSAARLTACKEPSDRTDR
jgi:hypothetical protein